MFWIDVCLHTAFFLAFLPVFYFEFVAPMQSYTVIDDIFEIVQPEFLNIALLTSLSSPQSLTKAVKLFNTELAENEQLGNIDSLMANNAQTKLRAYLGCEITAGLLFIIGISIAFWYEQSVFDLVMTNLIVLVFIAVSEFTIVGLFFKNFKEVDADFVKATLAQAFAESGPTVVSSEMKCNYTDRLVGSIFPSWLLNLFTK
jgi:hypothetical protein